MNVFTLRHNLHAAQPVIQIAPAHEAIVNHVMAPAQAPLRRGFSSVIQINAGGRAPWQGLAVGRVGRRLATGSNMAWLTSPSPPGWHLPPDLMQEN